MSWRTVACSIISIDDEAVDEPDLIVTRPRWSDSAFVMIPFGELAPDLLHGWVGPDPADVRNMGLLDEQ